MYGAWNALEAKDIFLLEIVQVASGAHPASYSIGIGVLSRGINGRGVVLPTHLHLGPKLKTPSCFHRVDGGNFYLYLGNGKGLVSSSAIMQ